IGVGVPKFNVGELKSWGTELDIRWKDKIGKNIQYHVGFNFSDNQNKVVRYEGLSSIGAGGLVPIMEGYALNTVWGYKTAGFFQTQAEVDDYKTHVSYPFFPNPKPGDIKY